MADGELSRLTYLCRWRGGVIQWSFCTVDCGQGRSDGGYIGIYTLPKTSPWKLFCALIAADVVRLLVYRTVVGLSCSKKLYPTKMNFWLRPWLWSCQTDASSTTRLYFAWVVDDAKCIVVTRVCVCLSIAACQHYCADPDVTWRSGSGCPLVVHCWADLQSVHGFRCYDNTHVCKGALYTANVHSAELEMPAIARARSMPGYVIIFSSCSLFYFLSFFLA